MTQVMSVASKHVGIGQHLMLHPYGLYTLLKQEQVSLVTAPTDAPPTFRLAQQQQQQVQKPPRDVAADRKGHRYDAGRHRSGCAPQPRASAGGRWCTQRQPAAPGYPYQQRRARALASNEIGMLTLTSPPEIQARVSLISAPVRYVAEVAMEGILPSPLALHDRAQKQEDKNSPSRFRIGQFRGREWQG